MTRRRSILLVDDEISVLQTLRMILEREGYKVTAAQSCAEALTRLKSRKFDAIIADLNMEADDIGFDVARAAVKLKPKPAVVMGVRQSRQCADCPGTQCRLSGNEAPSSRRVDFRFEPVDFEKSGKA